MILNERLLRVFVTFAEELHFGHAASALHLSQPALTAALKNLECDLAIRLFKRTGRNVELTGAGVVLLAHARHLIAESERTVALMRSSSSDLLGALQIGYDPATVNLPWLASLIKEARRRPPLTNKLQFLSSEATQLQQQLIRQNSHATTLFAGSCCHPDIQCVSLFQEPFADVCWSSHAL